MNLVGTRLGKFELRAEIGRGGMAVVYLGYDPALNRSVAVKVLPPQLAWQKGFVERFLREARAAAALNHTNIVTIHDVGKQDGWYYCVMEYLEGRPLSQVLRERGRLRPDEVLSILHQLADALDYAHERGLVHRDVKPANVMVDQQGRVTLTDFGLVRAAEESGLTVAGTVMGTPHYMSPEQARGTSQVGPASDLYSLAVIAYQMLCGAPPFDADSTPAILYRQVHEPPPLITARYPGLPPAVDAVLHRALAKEPRERYASGIAFVTALAGALERQALARTVPPRSRVPEVVQAHPAPSVPQPVWAVPWVWIAGGVVVLALVGVSFLVVLSGGGGDDQRPNPTLGLAFASDSTSSPEVALGATATAVSEKTTANPTVRATERVAPVSMPTDTPTPAPQTGPPVGAGPGDTWTRLTDTMVMVYVPLGTFMMGSDDNQLDRALEGCNADVGDCDRTLFTDEQPAHIVTLESFWIDQTEVTNAQYRKCVDAGACEAPTVCDWGEPTYQTPLHAYHPVVCVDWYGAKAYCEWAGARLPTEAEWEFVARGPNGFIYPWGDEFDCARGNFDDETLIDDYVVPGGEGCDGYARTALVGSFETGASWIGALDMAGNLWEWVHDWYGDYAFTAQMNPTGPETGEARVLRGGSWLTTLSWARSAFRYGDDPETRDSEYGFRCVVPATSAP
jgi:serine/threonine protein kinase/formylglycine-generating enzyme required for sulfatase activity